MLDCHAYRILITGYIDGELSDDEMQMLKAHLQTCKACFAYLTRAEVMKTVLKRCRLLQDIPEVSPHFAQNISHVIQQTHQQSRPSLVVRINQKYRAFVFDLVEKWISSLRARPFAWITSVSCVVALIAGIMFVDVFHTVYQHAPLQYTQSVPDEQVALRSVMEEPGRTMEEETPGRGESDSASSSSEMASAHLTEPSQFIEFADEPVTHLAKSRTEFVENPVYSHVLEAAQEHFFDDAVFVGYVQDVLVH